MNIVFVCGSLELGKDGVGDYTRRLSAELLKYNFTIGIIALNDRYINNVKYEIQTEQGLKIDTLRFPLCISWKEKIQISRKYIDNIDPDFLSLQYVPFGFHKKGMPFFLGDKLLKIGRNRRWHVMFHELWVGMNNEAEFSQYLIGKIQMVLIKSMLKKIIPVQIHTHIEVYKMQIENLGFLVKILPIFSNIPFCGKMIIKQNKKFIVAIFASIYSINKLDFFINELKKNKNNIDIDFVFFGDNGRLLDVWIDACNKHNVNFEVLGELNSEFISELLTSANLGIVTTPYLLIGKSGVAAAMKEHQLPIICIGDNWSIKGERIIGDQDIFPYTVGSLSSFFDKEIKNISYYTIKDVVNIFISDISMEFK